MRSSRRLWIGIVVVVGAAIAAFAILERQNAASEYQSTDDFLAAARKAAKGDQGRGAESGYVPGTDEKEGVPKIVMGKTTLDLGLVPNDHITVVDFPIKNAGTGTLVISDVGTSCHCTEGSMAQGENVIKPGGQGILKVSLDPSRVPDGFSSHKQLSIHCNDPQSPLVTLDVLSKVDPEFSVEPDTLAFGDIPKGKDVTKVLRVRQVNDQPFKVTSVVPLHPEDEKKMRLSFQPVPENEWAKPGHAEFTVSVTLPATISVGNFASGIKIHNTCTRQNVKEFYVPLTANVTSFYRLATSKLIIPATGVTPGKADIGSLVVDADRPFELSDLSVTEPLLSVTAKPGANPNSQALWISLSPLAGPGVKNGEIQFTIKSGAESFSESVPVQVVVPVAPK